MQGNLMGGYADYYTFLQKHAALIRDNLSARSEECIRKKYKWLAQYHNNTIAPLWEAAKLPKNKERFIAELETDPEEFFREIQVTPFIPF